jgi:hypothetical protein
VLPRPGPGIGQGAGALADADLSITALAALDRLLADNAVVEVHGAVLIAPGAPELGVGDKGANTPTSGSSGGSDQVVVVVKVQDDVEVVLLDPMTMPPMDELVTEYDPLEK